MASIRRDHIVMVWVGLYSYGMGRGYIAMAWVGVIQLRHPSVWVIYSYGIRQSGLYSYGIRRGYIIMAWGRVA